MNENTIGKRLRLWAVLAWTLAASVLLPTTLQSQETWPTGTGLGLFGGYAKLSDELHEGSVAYGFNLTYVISTTLAVELTGFRFESAVTGSEDGLSDGKLAVMPIQLSLQGRFPMSNGRLVPFIEAGGGYYLNTFNVDSGIVSDWNALGFDIEESVESAAGFHLGAGLDYFISRNICLGAAVKYCMATAKGSWSLTDTASGTEASGDLKDLKTGPLAFGIRLKYVLK